MFYHRSSYRLRFMVYIVTENLFYIIMTVIMIIINISITIFNSINNIAIILLNIHRYYQRYIH